MRRMKKSNRPTLAHRAVEEGLTSFLHRNSGLTTACKMKNPMEMTNWEYEELPMENYRVNVSDRLPYHANNSKISADFFHSFGCTLFDAINDFINWLTCPDR